VQPVYKVLFWEESEAVVGSKQKLSTAGSLPLLVYVVVTLFTYMIEWWRWSIAVCLQIHCNPSSCICAPLNHKHYIEKVSSEVISYYRMLLDLTTKPPMLQLDKLNWLWVLSSKWDSFLSVLYQLSFVYSFISCQKLEMLNICDFAVVMCWSQIWAQRSAMKDCVLRCETSASLMQNSLSLSNGWTRKVSRFSLRPTLFTVSEYVVVLEDLMTLWDGTNGLFWMLCILL